MRFVLVMVALAGCLDSQGFSYDPPVASGVDEREIPMGGPSPVDLLFVVDDTPAMASVRDRLLAATPTFAQQLAAGPAGLDLHIGVLSGDLYEHGQFRGDLLATQPNVELAPPNNFAGDLPAALAQRLDVGTHGQTNMMFENLKLALENHPDFPRKNTALMIVFVTAGDDTSIDKVESYIDYLQTVRGSWDLVVNGIYARPAPRLDALLAAFEQSTYTPIDGNLALGMPPEHWDLGIPCTSANIDPDRCSFWDRVDALGWERVLDRCDAAVSNAPCWKLLPDVGCAYDGPGYEMKIERALFPPANDVVHMQCLVAD